MRVAVVGESLFDWVEEADGRFRPVPGGSPFNAARAMARQGARVRWLTPLSTDRLGDRLAEVLAADGIDTRGPRSPLPTSLAVVQVGPGGQPVYALYRDGVADRDTDAATLVGALPEPLDVVHVGSLALVPGDLDRARAVLDAAGARGALRVADLNLRPGAVRDVAAYLDGVRALLPALDVVKASDEDLAGLGLTPRAVLDRLDDGLLALTLGAAGAELHTRRVAAKVAAPVVPVVDTIGAGDTFHGALLVAAWRAGWLADRGWRRADAAALEGPLRHAVRAAAIVVGRAGGEPPTWDEVVRWT